MNLYRKGFFEPKHPCYIQVQTNPSIGGSLGILREKKQQPKKKHCISLRPLFHRLCSTTSGQLLFFHPRKSQKPNSAGMAIAKAIPSGLQQDALGKGNGGAWRRKFPPSRVVYLGNTICLISVCCCLKDVIKKKNWRKPKTSKFMGFRGKCLELFRF